MNWEIVGYLGIFFAVVYRIPQIVKLYKTKEGGAISKTSFVIQNLAYVSFIVYLFSKDEKDYILISYEFMGIFQNCLILGLKMRYKRLSRFPRVTRNAADIIPVQQV